METAPSLRRKLVIDICILDQKIPRVCVSNRSKQKAVSSVVYSNLDLFSQNSTYLRICLMSGMSSEPTDRDIC